MSQKNCKNCQQNFEITDSDKAFYQKVQVPEPTHCPACREQRRLAFRNERNLFKRACDLCKKEMISFFRADVKFPVYCSECWWSDTWDALEYGQDFDFSRPFFPQFQELMLKVPKMGLLQLANENCEYNTLIAYSKNTYMSPGSYFMEDCYYCRKSQYCKDCLNSNFLDHCELVGQSVNCKNCYSGSYLLNCRNCSSSAYLADCSSCQNCFMCSGLNNKKFHIKNKAYTEAEYKILLTEYQKRDPADLMKEFQEFNKTVSKKYQNQINCENSSGDYIQNCKNAVECYDCFDMEDCKYVTESVSVKDSMDLSMHDKDIQLCYEICSGGESNTNLKFSFCPCASPNSDYLYSCFYTSDSFGCDSIHFKQSNCILNKKYTKDEYESLRARIIEHMKKSGEYGEYFPISISPHPYNYSNAFDFYPLSQEEALAKGYPWQEKDIAYYKPATANLPTKIGETKDEIIKEILACEKCGKNYKIIAQELQLSRKMGQPLSRFCPDCRQVELQNWKNKRKLWPRTCGACGQAIQTTYSPQSSEKVLCEKCYLQEVY